MVGPLMATMYATQIVQDEATSVMYMDTVTASVQSSPWESPYGGQPPKACSGGHH